MKISLLILSLLAAAWAVQAQPPDTLWTHEFADLYDASATGVVPSFSDGLALVGWQEFAPADTYAVVFPEDMLVVQTDATGNPEWTFRIANDGDTTYEGIAICRTQDSAYVALGQRSYRGERASYGDPLLIKLDRNGEELWRRSYRYQPQCYAQTLTVMNDGTILMGANLQIFHENDPLCTNNLFLADVNPANGDTLWTRQWRGYQCERLIQAAIATSDGGCLLTAADCPPGPYFCDQMIIKLNAQGGEDWERIDEAASAFGRVCLAEVGDGYVAGTNFYSITRLEKLSFSGQTEWLQPYEVETQRIEQPKAVAAAPDGGYYVACEAQLYASQRTAPVLIKTDAQGNMEWRMIADLATGNNSPAFCLTAEGQPVFAGNSFVPRAYQPGHMWMIEYGWPNSAATDRSALPKTAALEPNYPNPFNPTTDIAFDIPRAGKVTITVHDMLGRTVATLTNDVMTAGHHVVPFDGSRLPSGMYFCRLQTAGTTCSQKMVLLK